MNRPSRKGPAKRRPITVRVRPVPEPLPSPAFRRMLGRVLTGAGVTGTLAALLLLLERGTLVPGCQVGSILTCGPVPGTTDMLPLPDPVIGLITFPLVAALGAATWRGAPVPRWTWWALQMGATGGLLLVALYIARTLAAPTVCLLCALIWAMTITTFWYAVVHNLTAGRTRDELAVLDRFAADHHARLLMVWLLAPFVLLVLRFAPAGAAS